MNLKLLFVINDEDKKLSILVDKFKLPFNTLMHGEGTASQGILDFLGLEKTEKNVFVSIIPDVMEKDILLFIKKEMRIKEIGKGVAFTSPLSSSSQYIQASFKEKKGDKMKNNKEYHLLITIAIEGYADRIMDVAKKNGANGGTLIKGRAIGGKNSFKFFNIAVEPEKDIVLIVCKDEDKNNIMDAILEKCGANTDAKGICIALPINNTVGIDE